MTPEQRLMASQQIRSGIQSADRFINSKTVQDAVAHNEALAKRTKFNTSNSNILERPRLPETISVDLRSNIDNPKALGVFYRDNDYWLNRDPDKGLIVINTAPNQNISSSVFHEVNHAAGYIGSNGTNDLAANNFLQ